MGRDSDNWAEQIGISTRRFIDDLNQWVRDFFSYVGNTSQNKPNHQLPPPKPNLALNRGDSSKKGVVASKLFTAVAIVLLLIYSINLTGGSPRDDGVGWLGVAFSLSVLIWLGHSHVKAVKQFITVQPLEVTPSTIVEPSSTTTSLAAPVQPLSRFTVHLPKATEWDTHLALQFIQQLLFALPNVSLQIEADLYAVSWHIIDLTQTTPLSIVQRIVQGHYPRAMVTLEPVPMPDLDTPFFRYVNFYELLSMFVAPLKYVDAIKDFDPLTALAQTMADLQPGERVVYTLAVAGIATNAHKEGVKLTTKSTIHPLQLLSAEGRGDALVKVLVGADRTKKFEHRDQRTLEDKLREVLYRTAVMVQVDSPNPERLVEVVAMMDTHLSHFANMPYNALQFVDRAFETHTVYVQRLDQAHLTSALHVAQLWAKGATKNPVMPPDLILESREIAALWHMPHAGFSAPHLAWAAPSVDISDAVAKNTAGTLIGNGRYGGKEVPVYVSSQDRVTHINIIGKTGTGKSTLMHRLVHEDIARGEGVAVIDPHGSLVQDVLRFSIPAHREQDVVLLDLANEAYPPPFNPLVSLSSYTGTLRVISIIERLFAGTEQTTRTSTYLRAALTLLEGQAHPTMRDVGRIFMDEVYRERLLNQTDDPETQDLWDFQFNRASEGKKREIADPVLSRIRPFFANRYLYPALCHPEMLDFHDLMRQKKIILVSLKVKSTVVPDQEQRLVGALLVSALQLAGMDERLPHPFYVYVDEVQDFVTTSFAELLSEARKYGLSLTTANQYLGQLEGKTLDAVMGNVGTTFMFACSPEDKLKLATYTKPHFTADQLTDLDRFHAVVKMQVKGQSQPAFSLATLPPLQVSAYEDDRTERIRTNSIATYTPKSRSEILDELKQRYPRRPTDRTDGSTARQDDEDTFYDKA